MAYSDNSSFNSYCQNLNIILDEKLMNIISNLRSDQNTSNVQQLMRICSHAVIGALESSPPELVSSAKLFLNRLDCIISHSLLITQLYLQNITCLFANIYLVIISSNTIQIYSYGNIIHPYYIIL